MLVGVALRRRRRAQQRLDVAAARTRPCRRPRTAHRRCGSRAASASSACLSAVRPSRCSSFSTASRPRAIVAACACGVEPGAHLGLRARALQVAELGVEPVERRAAVLGGGHLDHLAALQRRVQRHHRAVDLGAAAAMAEIGVHGVGEVDRRRAGGELDDRGLRREDVDAVVERPAAGRRASASAPAVGEVALPGEQLAQHGLARLRDLRLERRRRADRRVGRRRLPCRPSAPRRRARRARASRAVRIWISTAPAVVALARRCAATGSRSPSAARCSRRTRRRSRGSARGRGRARRSTRRRRRR